MEPGAGAGDDRVSSAKDDQALATCVMKALTAKPSALVIAESAAAADATLTISNEAKMHLRRGRPESARWHAARRGQPTGRTASISSRWVIRPTVSSTKCLGARRALPGRAPSAPQHP